MNIPLGGLVSATSTTIKVVKWWRRRRDEARKIQRRREIIISVGLTTIAIVCAISGMILLADLN